MIRTIRAFGVVSALWLWAHRAVCAAQRRLRDLEPKLYARHDRAALRHMGLE